MAFVKGDVRKSVSWSYDPAGLEGDSIIITARNPETGEDFSPKKEVPKDGSFALAFPDGHTGLVEIAIHGSEGGSQTETVEV